MNQMSRMALAVYTVCLLLNAAVADDSSDAAKSPDWRSYNHDPSGSRYNSAEKWLNPGNASQLVEKWRFPTDDYKLPVGVIHATPTVVNGYVYFGTATYAAFYKLTPQGKVKWVYKLDSEPWTPRTTNIGTRLVPALGVYSSALVTDDSVYFGDGHGVFYALDRKTGTELWKVDSRADDFPGAHQSNVFLSSPILADGKIIIGGGGYEHAAAAEPDYECCSGRGNVIAFEPKTGEMLWKYDVGPEPEFFDPPITMNVWGVDRLYHAGPSTSSVWNTSSYDPESQTIYFGTDVHNAPRRPTDDDPRIYTEHTSAIIALDVRTGEERWITQIHEGDVWNHTLPPRDPKTGQLKDQSIGDTPKLYTIDVDGKPTKVMGFGCKDGGFYVLRASDGERLNETPRYTGPAVENPEVDPRVLALPSLIGGIQTGCATDGERVYVNGIDKMIGVPTGGRVTSVSTDLQTEFWRHNRPKVAEMPIRESKTSYTNVGDPVASGIAVANGVTYFTTMASNNLVALNAASGSVLKEIHIGPVFAGPSVSRGRVYIGTGNTLFSPSPREDFFPKRYDGTLYSFGLPGEDEIDRLGEGNE